MVNVAILGFGTVGSGVAEVLTKNSQVIAKKAGQEIHLKYILDTRDFPGNPFEDKITHDFAVIEQDPEVQVVVECIGGATIALDFVRRCLLAGKHVATSNKEMVATHGYELMSIAREKNVNFLFEASVGGGIPILRPLYFDLAGNEVQEVCGILNGTPNYILTKMILEGAAFDDVLKDAQAKGYAERNPAADVEGIDACRKVCILSALAFGFHVYPNQVFTEGITSISEADVAVANAGNMKLKLLGRTLRTPEGKVCAFVAPHFVPKTSQLANVEDVFNALLVRGNAIGEAMFYGPGAGKLPTASAVVADVIDALKNGVNVHDSLFWQPAPPAEGLLTDASPAAYYVRVSGAAPAVVAAIYGTGRLAAETAAGCAWYIPCSTPGAMAEAERKVQALGGTVALTLKQLPD